MFSQFKCSWAKYPELDSSKSIYEVVVYVCESVIHLHIDVLFNDFLINVRQWFSCVDHCDSAVGIMHSLRSSFTMNRCILYWLLMFFFCWMSSSFRGSTFRCSLWYNTNVLLCWSPVAKQFFIPVSIIISDSVGFTIYNFPLNLCLLSFLAAHLFTACARHVVYTFLTELADNVPYISVADWQPIHLLVSVPWIDSVGCT